MKNRHSVVWLAAINVILFVVQNAVSGFTDAFVLTADVASRPWLLLTSMFLHGDVFHLLSNMFALFVFGLILEHELGTKKFLALYFASGVASGLVGSLLYSSLLGASGAIFGVLGFLAAVQPRLVVWTYGVPMPMAVAAGFWLLLDVAGVFYPSNIANLSHIVGLILGAVLGLYSIRNRPRRKKAKQSRLVSEDEFRRWEDVWM